MEHVHMSCHNGFQVVLVPAVDEITQYGDHCVHHPHQTHDKPHSLWRYGATTWHCITSRLLFCDVPHVQAIVKREPTCS